MTTTQYVFDDSPSTPTTYAYRDKLKHGRARKHSRDGSSNLSQYYHSLDDDADGGASLTYSTTSSVNSCSIADESHDSSFADIMRVLDVHDGKDLASFLKRDYPTTNSKHGDERSTAESLAYSVDNESYTLQSHVADNESVLQGTDFLTAGHSVE